MEKRIVKTGVYSFILALFIGLLIFKGYSREVYDNSGVVSIMYDNLEEYIFRLLRFSAIVSLLSMLVAGLDRKNELIAADQYATSVVKLACVAICIGLAAYWFVIGIY